MSEYLLEVDQFTSQEHLGAFLKQQQTIVETMGALDLKDGDYGQHALVTGSSTFSLQGIDTYVDPMNGSDLDLVASNELFMRFHRAKQFTGPISVIAPGLYMGTMHPSKKLPMRVEVFTADDPKELEFIIGPVRSDHDNLRATSIGEVQIDGMTMVAAGVLAATKSTFPAPRVKDLAAIIKGQITGIESPIVDEELWKVSTALAIERLVLGDVDKTLLQRVTRTRPRYPSWLSQLVRVDFDHPAFNNIERK